MQIRERVHIFEDFIKWIDTFPADELVMHGWTPSTLAEVAKHYPYAVVYEGTDVCAALFYQILGPQHFEVLFLATAPHMRRKGYLTQLFLHFFTAYPELRLWLEYREDNHAARALYSRHGFVEIGRRERYYNDGKAAILMEFYQKP